MGKNEIAATNYTTLQGFNLADALSEEMAGMNVAFDRIKIPVGGGLVFEMPESGETETVKEFSGVILYHHPLFAYYSGQYTGGHDAPDCGSYDGVTGAGIPGGECARCPYNQFGSGLNGGKACKDKRRIYLLREGELIPLLLTLPTGSMKEFGAYVKRLLSRGRKTNAVVTRFSLQKATNVGGIVFAQAHFAMERPLTDEELPYVLAMAEQVKAFAGQVGYEDEPASSIAVNPETGEIIEDEPAARPLN